jgi:hypothetical protein
MFSNKITKILAVILPLVLAFGNQVPSNIFLSVATVCAFFAFYVRSCGSTRAHESLKWTAIVAAMCCLALAPVVVFDNFYFFDDPAKSTAANVLKAISGVSPFFVFFTSLVYAAYVVISAVTSLFTSKRTRNVP